jgi:hypothetical protein
MKGRGKRLIIHFVNDAREEPDLMYLLADHISIGDLDLRGALSPTS